MAKTATFVLACLLSAADASRISLEHNDLKVDSQDSAKVDHAKAAFAKFVHAQKGRASLIQLIDAPAASDCGAALNAMVETAMGQEGAPPTAALMRGQLCMGAAFALAMPCDAEGVTCSGDEAQWPAACVNNATSVVAACGCPTEPPEQEQEGPPEGCCAAVDMSGETVTEACSSAFAEAPPAAEAPAGGNSVRVSLFPLVVLAFLRLL